MAKAPAFQWYPKECDSDESVRLMDDAEFGFYVRCLNHSWINEGLPVDIEDISRIIGRPLETVEKYWRRVGRCFTETDGRLRNPRQESQRKELREFKESRVAAANSRWANSKAMQVHMQELCTTDARASENGCTADASAVQNRCSATASATASANQEETSFAASATTETKAQDTAKEPRRKKRTQLTADTIPAEWAEFSAKEFGWGQGKSESTFQAFRDYWLSRGEPMADWLATWRRWCRNDKQARTPTLFPDRNETRRAETIAMTTMLRGMQQ